MKAITFVAMTGMIQITRMIVEQHPSYIVRYQHERRPRGQSNRPQS